MYWISKGFKPLQHNYCIINKTNFRTFFTQVFQNIQEFICLFNTVPRFPRSTYSSLIAISPSIFKFFWKMNQEVVKRFSSCQKLSVLSKSLLPKNIHSAMAQITKSRTFYQNTRCLNTSPEDTLSRQMGRDFHRCLQPNLGLNYKGARLNYNSCRKVLHYMCDSKQT